MNLVYTYFDNMNYKKTFIVNIANPISMITKEKYNHFKEK